MEQYKIVSELNSTEKLPNGQIVIRESDGIRWIKKLTQIRSLKLLHFSQLFSPIEIHRALRL